MDEYGIFSSEGCLEAGFYSRDEAESAIAERYDAEDGVEIHRLCPDPDHHEQPAFGCERCAEDDDDDDA